MQLHTRWTTVCFYLLVGVAHSNETSCYLGSSVSGIDNISQWPRNHGFRSHNQSMGRDSNIAVHVASKIDLYNVACRQGSLNNTRAQSKVNIKQQRKVLISSSFV
jgi:hypothetical protein